MRTGRNRLVILAMGLLLPALYACPGSPLADVLSAEASIRRTDLSQTPFGSIFTLPNWPHTTVGEFQEAFVRLKTLGTFVCYIWEWLDGDVGLVHATKTVASARERGFDIFLQMGPQRLGDVTPPSGFGIDTFTDPLLRKRYVNDAVKLAELQPKWLVLATEINLLLRGKPEEFDAFTIAYQEAYARVKEVSPDTLVGVSYHVLAMVVDQRFEIIDQMGPQDFIGFTTYPDSLVSEGPFESVETFPRTYYNGLRELLHDRPIAITEMGWTTFSDPGMDEQRTFISRLPTLLDELDPIFVCWAMLYDADAFDIRYLTDSQRFSIVTRFGVDPDLLFARLNHMALFTGSGVAKPSYFTALDVFGGAERAESP